MVVVKETAAVKMIAGTVEETSEKRLGIVSCRFGEIIVQYSKRQDRSKKQDKMK